jgi:hypothetical protein
MLLHNGINTTPIGRFSPDSADRLDGGGAWSLFSFSILAPVGTSTGLLHPPTGEAGAATGGAKTWKMFRLPATSA